MWSLHPAHLDRIGLVALWRETLLAQAVLAGRTKGYQHHPQLDRFRGGGDPAALVGAYLDAIAAEATARGYRFDRSKIDVPPTSDPGAPSDGEVASGVPRIEVTRGQLEYEREHLARKLEQRSPDDAVRLARDPLRAHPLFDVVDGPIAEWERP